MLESAYQERCLYWPLGSSARDRRRLRVSLVCGPYVARARGSGGCRCDLANQCVNGFGPADADWRWAPGRKFINQAHYDRSKGLHERDVGAFATMALWLLPNLSFSEDRAELEKAQWLRH